MLEAEISWVQTMPCPRPVLEQDVVLCPPDGHLVNVTIGCKCSYTLYASAPAYRFNAPTIPFPCTPTSPARPKECL